MKVRFNCYFAPKLADRLGELAVQRGVSRSQLVEAMVASCMSPDALDRHEGAFGRRLDHLSGQIARILYHLAAIGDGQAFFARYWLSAASPPSESTQAKFWTLGEKRYDEYVEIQGKWVKERGGFGHEIPAEIPPGQAAAGANGWTSQAERDVHVVAR